MCLHFCNLIMHSNGWKRYSSAKKINEANLLILISWFMLPTEYGVMHNSSQ